MGLGVGALVPGLGFLTYKIGMLFHRKTSRGLILSWEFGDFACNPEYSLSPAPRDQPGRALSIP